MIQSKAPALELSSSAAPKRRTGRELGATSDKEAAPSWQWRHRRRRRRRRRMPMTLSALIARRLSIAPRPLQMIGAGAIVQVNLAAGKVWSELDASR